MHPIAKTLLVLEVLLCFGPAFLLLFAGAIFVVESGFEFWTVAPVLGGLAGLLALANAISWIFDNDANVMNPKFVLICLILGVVSLLPFLQSEVPILNFVIVATLVASAHLMYLARDYLLLPWRKG